MIQLTILYKFLAYHPLLQTINFENTNLAIHRGIGIEFSWIDKRQDIFINLLICLCRKAFRRDLMRSFAFREKIALFLLQLNLLFKMKRFNVSSCTKVHSLILIKLTMRIIQVKMCYFILIKYKTIFICLFSKKPTIYKLIPRDLCSVCWSRARIYAIFRDQGV